MYVTGAQEQEIKKQTTATLTRPTQQTSNTHRLTSNQLNEAYSSKAVLVAQTSTYISFSCAPFSTSDAPGVTPGELCTRYNTISIWLSSPRFLSPNPIGRGFPPDPPSANQGARRARREEQPPQSRCIRGGLGLISGSDILPYIYNFNTPGKKIEFSRVDTAVHGVETPIPTGRSLIGWGA